MPRSATDQDGTAATRPASRGGRLVRVVAAVLAVALAGYAVALSRRPSAPGPVEPVSGEGPSVVVGSPAACVVPSTLPTSSLGDALPAGLAMPERARLLEVRRDDFGVTVIGESPMTIPVLHAAFRRQLVAAGLEIFAEDNEGIESELFFTDPAGRIGAIRQTRARCPIGATRFIVSIM